jgi:hypothetical protein
MSPKLPVSLSVLLPSSLVADAPKLREKTVKIGLIGRTLAIFRVPKIVLYDDDDPHISDQEAEVKLIEALLRYMDTPPYLRRLVFPRTREFRYVGLLPPLRTPHHPLRDVKTKAGDYREAVVIEVKRDGSLLELGLPEKGTLGEKLKVGQRLTVKLGKRSGNQIAVTCATRAEVQEYWGFEISTAKSLADALNGLKADYVIGTSRYGQDLNEAVRGVKKSKPNRVAIALGGPYAGLYEICERQGADPDRLFDVMVNTIPNQGTETVRTEEALLATLALFNVMIWGR